MPFPLPARGGKVILIAPLTTLATPAGANADGAWTTLIDPIPASVDVLSLAFSSNLAGSNSIRHALIDLALGAAGSEQEIASDLNVVDGSNVSADGVMLPLRLPRGERLSGRYRTDATVTLTPAQVGVSGLRGTLDHPCGFARVETIGSVPASSKGTTVDPGASGNLATKGAYAELTAATTRDAAAFLLAFAHQTSGLAANVIWNVDVALGAGGSEQVVLADLRMLAESNSDIPAPGWFGPFFLPIPAGTRVAIRASSNNTTATTRQFDVAAYLLS